jgi:hypothetical protein
MPALLGQEIEHLDSNKEIEVKLTAAAQGQCAQPAVGYYSRRRSDHRVNARDRERSHGVRIRPSSGGLDWVDAKRTWILV